MVDVMLMQAEGSWSMSPTIKRAALSGTAFMSA
jgi:hypothetical protein